MTRWGSTREGARAPAGIGGARGRRARVGAHTDQRRQELQGLAHVGDLLDVRLVARVNLGRREVDVDKPGAPRGVPAGRRVLDRVVAHGHDGVRLGEAGPLDVLGDEPDRRDHERVVGGERALGHERRHHGDLRALGEECELPRRPPADHPVAGEDQRALRLVDDVRRAREGRPVGRRAARLVGPERLALRGFLGHVLRQLQVAGPGLLLLGDLERLPDNLGDDRARLDLRVPFREGPECLDDVDELVGLLVEEAPRQLAGDRDDRRAIEIRVGQAGGEVRRPRPEGRQAHPRLAREPPPDVRHEGGRLLVADGDETDGRVEEGVVQVEGLLAGHAEDVAHALPLEAADQELGSGHGVDPPGRPAACPESMIAGPSRFC
jgi:hypothetical protein